jgi:hypothetical protein
MLVAVGLAWGAPGHASERLILDGRDAFTLLDPHPLNHQLFLQLEQPQQAFRLGPRAGKLTALADVEIGTQQLLKSSDTQSRFHGWYAADMYAAYRPLEGLELNLNLLLVNPSASDGYRASSTVHPGVTLHVWRELFELDRHPVRLDVIGLDLGWTTTGVGLLLESTPLEGVAAVARWKSWEASYLVGGRALWQNDDYRNVSLRAFGGLAELNVVNWQRVNDDTSQVQTVYATLSSRWAILPFLHLAEEFGYRVDTGPKVGALVRLDALLREDPRWGLHLGYQLRYYQAGFGPRARLDTPTWPYSPIAQQDIYQTNPFEYLGISAAYEQWSHSFMGEGRVRLFQGLEPFLNLEVIQRYARSQTVPRFVVYTPDGFRAPGQRLRAFFEGGVRVYPFKGLPHRGTFSVSNHGINTGDRITDPVDDRTHRGLFYVATLEARL